MAKLPNWARNIIAKSKAFINAAAQNITRLWHSFSTPAKWAVVVAVILAFLLLYGIINKGLGYTATITEIIMNDAMATVSVKATSTSAPWGRFLRDALIAIAALVAMYIAWRRSDAFFRQTKVAEDRLFSDQFVNASELMAKETANKETDKKDPSISARINGIYIMADLAIKQPEEFTKKVVNALAAYIRGHIQNTAGEQLESEHYFHLAEARSLGEDIKIAFDVLHNIFSNNKTKDIARKVIVDFSGQNFSRFDLRNINLQYYKNWRHTDFSHSILTHADFRGVDLSRTKMCRTDLSYADLRGASFYGADMPGVRLLSAKGQGADFSFAKFGMFRAHNIMEFGETCMCGAEIANLSDDAKKEMQGKIWYFDDNKWAQGIDRISSDFKWDLTKYKDGTVLAGIVRNFSREAIPVVMPPGALLRMQARKMLDNGDLPKDFPARCIEWLEKIDPKTGICRKQTEES